MIVECYKFTQKIQSLAGSHLCTWLERDQVECRDQTLNQSDLCPGFWVVALLGGCDITQDGRQDLGIYLK